jgi:hypothetical protein
MCEGSDSVGGYFRYINGQEMLHGNSTPYLEQCHVKSFLYLCFNTITISEYFPSITPAPTVAVALNIPHENYAFLKFISAYSQYFFNPEIPKQNMDSFLPKCAVRKTTRFVLLLKLVD